MANVEALASNPEYSGKTCYNTITSKESHTVLYCPLVQQRADSELKSDSFFK